MKGKFGWFRVHSAVGGATCAIVVGLAIAPATSTLSQETDDAGSGNVVHNRKVYLHPHPEPGTLTRNWFGAGDELQDLGVTSTLNLWTIYQANVSGGLSKRGAANGQYQLSNHFDLERLLGLQGTSAFALIEGGWHDGINSSVGSLMGVNGTSLGDEAAGVPRFWIEQDLLGDRIRLRAGKMDVSADAFDFHDHSVAFDAMPFANTPRTQFLNGGLVNNAAVPFPAPGLAGMLFVELVESCYIATAAFDRNTNAFDMNFSNAFDEWMTMVETGMVVSPGEAGLAGFYYAGCWYSTFPGAPDGNGVYFGASQQLYRESKVDDQGFGAFARYGYADPVDEGIRHFWSLGGQYRGLFPGRDRDILAIGWAQAFTDGDGFSAPSEGGLEMYYRARITPWIHLSSHLQYIANPGSDDISDAFTLGVRGQITF